MRECDRCKRETHFHTGSSFNTDDICPSCEELEKKHPKYQEAVDAVTAQEALGNLNYKGIGCPDELYLAD